MRVALPFQWMPLAAPHLCRPTTRLQGLPQFPNGALLQGCVEAASGSTSRMDGGVSGPRTVYAPFDEQDSTPTHSQTHFAIVTVKNPRWSWPPTS
eukprot:917609-Alexandrium_andersonii.AAC.1